MKPTKKDYPPYFEAYINLIEEKRYEKFQKNISKENALMIGDREHDILAANHLCMQSVGVLYGFGSKEEMDNCKPTYLVASVDELRNLLN